MYPLLCGTRSCLYCAQIVLLSTRFVNPCESVRSGDEKSERDRDEGRRAQCGQAQAVTRERVVHARGSGAHGYFECYKPLTDLTRASIFAEAGKRTPVFVRFSTVIGERGSADTVRDVRGFAVKFYTDEGNWDLVGNNIPVFFIQDAMKFPDLIHAAKPEPHFAMPQAATAHDTFWDFVSLTPESTHMLMWAMSDRALPRSYRMMEGFGVHTFRFVNAKGESKFVKFHWEPIAGTHSLDWDETVKIAGADGHVEQLSAQPRVLPVLRMGPHRYFSLCDRGVVQLLERVPDTVDVASVPRGN